MSNEPFKFAIDPIVAERNARRLIDVLAQFPGGATSEELRIRFEEVTTLKRQTFYDTLNYVKYRRWFVGGGGSNKPYQLNPDCSWKPPPTSVGQAVEKDRTQYLVELQTQQIAELQDEVERLLDFTNGDGTNVALASLVRIVGDSAATERQRIKAAGAVLGYKVPDDSAVEFTKRYLESVCTSADVATDYRIEAGELLRKHEAPRVLSEIVRPNYREDGAAPKLSGLRPGGATCTSSASGNLLWTARPRPWSLMHLTGYPLAGAMTCTPTILWRRNPVGPRGRDQHSGWLSGVDALYSALRCGSAWEAARIAGAVLARL